jgi:hypothetical protein
VIVIVHYVVVFASVEIVVIVVRQSRSIHSCFRNSKCTGIESKQSKNENMRSPQTDTDDQARWTSQHAVGRASAATKKEVT